MAQILDLGNVVGPAGPNEITENTETNLTGVLIGANGKVTAMIPSADTLGVVAKTGDTMTGTLTVPEVYTKTVQASPDSGSYKQNLTLQATVKSGDTSSFEVASNVVLIAQAYTPKDTGNLSATPVSKSLTFGYSRSDMQWLLYPSGDDNRGAYLGSPANRWTTLYISNGEIQTSDRAAKDDIRYLVDESAPMVLSLTDEDTDATAPAAVTVGDVMDFVRNLAPVTFCYKDGAESASEETARPESIQLGLIANDIENHPLFKYVGVKNEYEAVVTPEELDEEGNVITEAVTETKTMLGLQAIPLATVALTACKKLTEEMDSVNARMAELEMKMETILSKEDM